MKMGWVLLSSMILLGFNNCGKNDYQFNSGDSSTALKSQAPQPDPQPDPNHEPDPVDPSSCEHLSQRKMCICHVPDGNSAARSTIIINKSAVPAHLEDYSRGESHHDDYPGACQ